MENMIGECRYCGLGIGVMAETQAEANEIASRECSCAESKIENKKKAMRDRIEELAGAGCEELGFSPVDPEICEEIKAVGSMIIEGKLQQASFKVDGTNILIKAGEKTKVTRKYTYEQTGEIE